MPASTNPFDALLTQAALPPAQAQAAAIEPLDDGAADTPGKVPTEDESADGASLLGLWLQWMRPLPPPVADPTPAAGSEAAAALPKTAASAASVAQALPPALATLSEALPEGGGLELPQTGADPLATTLAEAAAGTASVNPQSFAAIVDASASAPPPTLLPLDVAMTTAQSPVSASQPPAPSAPPPVIDTRQADWTQQLGEHIAWSLDEQQDAVIELHPAELGSLSVRVEMRGNDAQVTIVAASAAARDLLQQSLPQLRELLSVQGLNLARAQVERSSAGHNGNPAQGEGNARERGSGSRGRRALGALLLVDAYA
ncbi:MAG TPA: flagellar hook-length control protein FliK [Fontimonas sp.]